MKDLIERLIAVRENNGMMYGEYDTVTEAAAALSSQAARIKEARLEGIRLGLEAAAAHVQADFPHDKRVLVPSIRALDPATIAGQRRDNP